MKLYRLIWTLALAIAVAASGVVCFGQAAKKEKEIYNERVDARAEIKEALKRAATENKRVILVFGANWCYDCRVLDAAFHRGDLAAILTANYEVVHVDIGKGEKNQDLVEEVRGSAEPRHPRTSRARPGREAGLQPEERRIRKRARACPGRFPGIPEQVETRSAEPLRVYIARTAKKGRGWRRTPGEKANP